MAISNRNDMRFCKAFYRQQIYATSQEAKQVQVKALVIHGVEDLVLPVAAGEHLQESLGDAEDEMAIIRVSSHLVFQEKPSEVAEAIVAFMSKLLTQ